LRIATPVSSGPAYAVAAPPVPSPTASPTGVGGVVLMMYFSAPQDFAVFERAAPIGTTA
jgi:hypothetical protein